MCVHACVRMHFFAYIHLCVCVCVFVCVCVCVCVCVYVCSIEWRKTAFYMSLVIFFIGCLWSGQVFSTDHRGWESSGRSGLHASPAARVCCQPAGSAASRGRQARNQKGSGRHCVWHDSTGNWKCRQLYLCFIIIIIIIIAFN